MAKGTYEGSEPRESQEAQSGQSNPCRDRAGGWPTASAQDTDASRLRIGRTGPENEGPLLFAVLSEAVGKLRVFP